MASEGQDGDGILAAEFRETPSSMHLLPQCIEHPSGKRQRESCFGYLVNMVQPEQEMQNADQRETPSL